MKKILAVIISLFLIDSAFAQGSTIGGSGGIGSVASTATALVANGANCSAGSAPLGVDASGAAESCTDFEEDLANSAGLAAALSDETGTGLAAFATAPTFTTSITIGSAGVKLSDDGDGALTFLGLGDGSDEDLTLNLDDTSNTGVFTSSTLLATLNFSSIALQESGIGVLNNDEIDASSELLAIMDDETGTGALVFATSPVFTTPNIGSATGSVSGNAGTATALAANGGNCSAGSSPLGVDTLGAVESCTDYWTEAENTAAAYITASVTTLSSLVSIGTITTGTWNATDVAIGAGGTGATLVDPNADAMFTWDDSAGASVFMQVGNGLNINATPTLAADTASDTVDGVVELATIAETTTGTDTGRAVTPDGLAGSVYGTRVITLMVLDDSESCATGDGAGDVFWRVPSVMNGYDLVGVAAMVEAAGTTGTETIQVANETQAADMLTTRITIDSAETDTLTAATAAVIDTANDDVATGDEIRIDIDACHTTPATGTIVELQFRIP